MKMRLFHYCLKFGQPKKRDAITALYNKKHIIDKDILTRGGFSRASLQSALLQQGFWILTPYVNPVINVVVARLNYLVDIMMTITESCLGEQEEDIQCLIFKSDNIELEHAIITCVYKYSIQYVG